MLRPQEDWERPRRAEGGYPQGAEDAVDDGWMCEGRVSVEMCWGDVMRCTAGPPGSWVLSCQNRGPVPAHNLGE